MLLEGDFNFLIREEETHKLENTKALSLFRAGRWGKIQREISAMVIWGP